MSSELHGSSSESPDYDPSKSVSEDEYYITDSCRPNTISELEHTGRFATRIGAASDEGSSAGAHGGVKALIVQHDSSDQATLDLYLPRGQILQSLKEARDALKGSSFLDNEYIDFEPLSIISDGRQQFGCRLDTAPYPVDTHPLFPLPTTPPEGVWTPEATVQHVLYVIPATNLATGQTHSSELRAACVRVEQGGASCSLIEWATRWKGGETEGDNDDDNEEGQADESGKINGGEASNVRPDNLDTYHMPLEKCSGGYRGVLDIESLQQTTERGKIAPPLPIWFGKTREQARHFAEDGSLPSYFVYFTARLLTLYRPSAKALMDGSLRASEVNRKLPQGPYPSQPDPLDVLSLVDLPFNLGAVNTPPVDNRTDQDCPED